MRLSFTSIGFILLFASTVFTQDFLDSDQEFEEQDVMYEEEEVAQNVYTSDFFPAVAVASFTGPSIIGEFSFYQDGSGEVRVTGALQKGLKQDRKYQFRFHQGPDCENIGDVLYEHEFENMHVLDIGGTPPVQEVLTEIHLTGEDGVMGLPWVLADEKKSLACVMIKGNQSQ